MIDFYSQNLLTNDELRGYLAFAFELDLEDIFVTSQEDLERNTISNKFRCLCVTNFVTGSVKQLLSIYRIEVEKDIFIQRTVTFSRSNPITLFIPIDDYDEYIKINDGKTVSKFYLQEDFGENIVLLTQ